MTLNKHKSLKVIFYRYDVFRKFEKIIIWYNDNARICALFYDRDYWVFIIIKHYNMN